MLALICALPIQPSAWNVSTLLGVGPRRLESAMCWKCQEIDREIEHYHGLSVRTTDEGSVKSLNILIAKLEGEKKELQIAEPDLHAKTAPPR
jgi:hypothetical protein